MRHLAILVLSLVFLVFSSQAVLAQVSPPAFPSCPTPGGTLKINYPSGIHGIPGDSGTYTGSDSVYALSNDQLVQCFCPQSGQVGIQTNWWQVAELSQSDIDHFKSLGWGYIPDGSAWGLNPAFYFAYNSTFSCGGGGGGGFSPSGPGPAPVCTAAKPSHPVLQSVKRNGSFATLTWTKVEAATHYAIWYGTTPGKFDFGVANTGKVTEFTVGSLDPAKQYYWEVRSVNDCMPSDPASIGGQVLGAFAPTGNILTIIVVAALGLILLGLSLLTRDRTTSQS